MSTKCGRETEVFSRVVGYHRPIKHWHQGKREEFRERKPYNTQKVTKRVAD